MFDDCMSAITTQTRNFSVQGPNQKKQKQSAIRMYNKAEAIHLIAYNLMTLISNINCLTQLE